MSEVLDELRRDHANLARLLDALEHQLGVFDGGGRPDYDVITGVIDYCLSYPDRYHHPKEDLVLAKLRLRDPAAYEKVRNLDQEHRKLADLTRRFRALTEEVLHDAEIPRAEFSETVREFINTYRQHMAWEDDGLFKPAEHSLEDQDWREITGEIAGAADPLFGPQVAKEFEALRRDIVDMDRGVL